MSVFRTAAAAIACFILPLGSAAAQAPDHAATAARPQQVTIGGPSERIAMLIWQPAADRGEGLPLVIISHGTGAGPLAHVDTAQALAEAGFVVVAPMHRGDNFQDDSIVGRPEWMANRTRDVSSAIDFMLQQWPGRTRLDPARIGIFGFSAGATTALVSVGGVPDLERIAAHCLSRREFVCDVLAPRAAATGAPPQWVHDPRIRAAVVAAPGLGFAFEPAGLDAVGVPVQLWSGAADQTVPYETNAGVVRRLLRASVDFHSVDDAVHLSFLAPCSPESPPQLCQDSPGFDRAAFHREFNRSVIEFLRTRLRSRDSGG